MPELPEIEHLRRTLAPTLIGAEVVGVTLRRRDFIRNGRGAKRRQTGGSVATRLLRGTRVARLLRHGKQLAIVGENGRVVCVHLGMSGQMTVVAGDGIAKAQAAGADHVHCVWDLQAARGGARLVLRDPRRFGGLWLFDSVDTLVGERWSTLGPDALTLDGATLALQLGDSKRPIKAALMDQTCVAGIGNIYADEMLFLAGIHPRKPTRIVARRDSSALAHACTTVLSAAITRGGSSIRDYIDGNGQAGSYAGEHLVYGRAGQACVRCGGGLRGIVLAQRSTVFCPCCQQLRGPSRQSLIVEIPARDQRRGTIVAVAPRSSRLIVD